MTNIRPCKQCGKRIDFSDPYCDHETMEESAWRDINERFGAAQTVRRIAEELGYHAGLDVQQTTKKAQEK